MASLFIRMAQVTKGFQPISHRQRLKTRRILRQQISSVFIRNQVLESLLSLNLRLRTKNDARQKMKFLAPDYNMTKNIRCYNPPIVLTCTAIPLLWTLQQSKVQCQKQAELRKITTAQPNALIQKLPSPDFKIQLSNGNLVKVTKQVLQRLL